VGEKSWYSGELSDVGLGVEIRSQKVKEPSHHKDVDVGAAASGQGDDQYEEKRQASRQHGVFASARSPADKNISERALVEADMEVKMVAFESLGVSSMCTHVSTPDLSVMIDPGVACHRRSGLKPHPIEYETLVRRRAEMLSLSRETDVITVSHYHVHHFASHESDLVTTFSTKALADEINRGKVLLCKDPERNVVEIQGRRGSEFRSVYGSSSPRYEVADGRSFDFGQTEVSFSPALWHGKEDSTQGCVLGTCIRDREETVVHASDVQLLDRGCVDWMLGQEPDIAVVAGPPIFDPERVKGTERSVALGLLGELAAKIPQVIVDHHLLRAADWRDFLAKDGEGTMCAANFDGRSPMPLESRRAELYEEEDVEKGFHEHLIEGRVPARLQSVLHEEGMESYYQATGR
jgi:predicted metallo-beta-lactamase superfamily hydrolase